jgi:carboxypeptidase family protein/TonB-dependent receptor-like protein
MSGAVRKRLTVVRQGICALWFVAGLLLPCATAMPQRGGIVLSVVVRDASTGAGVAEAEVTVRDANLRARTDSLGRALFSNVPAAARLIFVRRMGYEPLVAPIQSTGGDTARVAFLLTPVAQPLPRALIVDSDAFSPLPEFESRRGKRAGWFITEREIRAAFGSRLSDLVMTRVPGLRFKEGPFGTVSAYSTRGPRSIHGDFCTVAVYFDGVRVSTAAVDLAPLSLLAGIEYYTPGFVPVQYRSLGAAAGEDRGSAACGVLLLWTIH